MQTSDTGQHAVLTLTRLKKILTTGVALSALICATTAATAQDNDTVITGNLETVTVTGYRASLESALNIKRRSAEMVDAINAEDIAAFPDSNLAESLQRLPGVTIDRENGEGNTITVRGLSADFTRVTLNGLEALSTAGASTAGDDPNRSRQFNFNTFASELFSGLKVHKSPAAETDEGSLGATVELQTGRPFDTGNKVVLSVQNAWYETGHAFNPRIAGLVSHTFLGGRIGVLASVAYNMRHQAIDGYQRSPSYSDYLYRQGYLYGPASKATLNSSGYYANRTGFASAIDYAGSGSCDDVSPGQTIENSLVCASLTGSNAGAYDTITQGTGGVLATSTNYKSYYTNASVLAANGDTTALTMFPALATLNKRDLYQTRIGSTLSVQARINDKMLLTLDGMFSSTYQDSTNYQLSTVGLNRNNTSSYLTAVTSDSDSGYAASVEKAYTKSSYASGCTAQGGDNYYAAVACNSGDLYNYYSNGGSDPTTALSQLLSFVGKPATKVAKATVKNNQATYLEMANLDLRSAADSGRYTTQFQQVSGQIDYVASDDLVIQLTGGYSESRNKQTGLLAEFNRMDAGSYDPDTDTCTSCFVYDATGGGSMPSLIFPTDESGYSVADPEYWSFVKGYSALRDYVTYTNNAFTTGMIKAEYTLTDQFAIKGGFAYKVYDFDTTKYTRVVADVYNVGLDEINSAMGTSYSVADLGKTVNFGAGISVPDGTPRRFFVPDLTKFNKIFGLGSNKITSYGNGLEENLTISSKYTADAGSAYAATYDVSEDDKSYYAQFDFQNIFILDRELRGNIGLRFVTTNVEAAGRTTIPGISAQNSNSYHDFLPAANLAYNLTDDMLIRAATSMVMSRPQLSALAPGITKISIPTDNSDATATATMGNTKLKPYRAKTVDFSYEWYFSKGGVISVAAFGKWIKNVVQQVTANRGMNDVISETTRQGMIDYYQNLADNAETESSQEEYIYQVDFLNDTGNTFDVTRYENNKGGVLEGIEITYQQNLTFLPAPFDKFGINANYTLIHSKMNYIIQPAVLSDGEVTQEAVYGYAPWTGASPNAYNVTVYYDTDKWTGRVSVAYRSQYVSQYPIKTGTAAPGYSDSPVMNDAIYSKSTFNMDASFTYNVNQNLQFRLDAENLTAQTENRWAFKSLAYRAVSQYSAYGRQVRAGFRLKF